MEGIKNITKLSMNHREQIKDDTPCGCYFCIEVFAGKDIEKWTDGGQTALCPNCNIDAVVPNETNTEFLVSACEYWFTGQATD